MDDDDENNGGNKKKAKGRKKVPIHHPHDQFCKNMLSDLSLAKDLMQSYLPTEVTADMDWRTLKFHSNEYVDAELKGKQSDLLYSIKLKGEDAYIYTLVEHQSASDPWMSFRLLSYMVSIWQRHLKENKTKPKQLPKIIPIVLHQGKRKWNAAMQFSDYFGEYSDSFTRYIPDFRYELIDLPAMEWEELQGGLALQFLLGVMKSARGQAIKELMEFFHSNSHLLLKHISKEDLRTVTIYLLSNNERAMVKEIQAVTTTPVSDIMKSALESYYEEGIEKGIEKGRQEGIEEGMVSNINTMHGKGFEPKDIASILDIPYTKVMTFLGIKK